MEYLENNELVRLCEILKLPNNIDTKHELKITIENEVNEHIGIDIHKVLKEVEVIATNNKNQINNHFRWVKKATAVVIAKRTNFVSKPHNNIMPDMESLFIAMRENNITGSDVDRYTISLIIEHIAYENLFVGYNTIANICEQLVKENAGKKYKDFINSFINNEIIKEKCNIPLQFLKETAKKTIDELCIFDK